MFKQTTVRDDEVDDDQHEATEENNTNFIEMRVSPPSAPRLHPV